ncbi:MAG: oxidoreductase [Bacteroidales bacterium]|nr:oxidoreductase [Bacteroidales bacterium]
MNNTKPITLMVLNPGHFHASLVQKTMYPEVDSIVYVYAPDGMELEDYEARIAAYNTREDNPTNWKLRIYRGDDFFEKMLEEKPGNLVVLAGNNRNKTEYIHACIEAGIHVYSDKPMAIEPSDYALLKDAFDVADRKGLLLYDIMTERYEITTMMQKFFSEQKPVFGELVDGTLEEPAITKESVHHFFKYVSGKPLKRPDWFFDITQQGEAIADVGTHLVDLVMWEAFPGGVSLSRDSMKILSARRWETAVDPVAFEKVTGLKAYPSFLEKYITGGVLQVPANSSLDFTLNGKHCRVSVAWNFQAPEGTGDTHYSIMRGTLSDLIIRQGAEENYRPQLYVEAKDKAKADILQGQLQLFFNEKLGEAYPGVSIEHIGPGAWRVNIPDKYRNGHEAHFAQVTQKFLGYYAAGALPAWEVEQMIAKYHLTTGAVGK